jgi:hypothetical protein
MTRGIVLAAILLSVFGTALADHEGEGDRNTQAILAFDTMYGVDGGFIGGANAIRGIVGDESPWNIAGFARGRLDVDGHLRLKVRGLVFGNDPSVPPGEVGKNDETDFRAAVSCLTQDAAGNVSTANVITAGFPATTTGDSDIDATLALPSPCIAPIVMVLAGSEDKWFAVTGFEPAPTPPPGPHGHPGHPGGHRH